MGDSVKYQVYFTPKVNDDTYGDEINVSEYVEVSGVGRMTKSIDSSDYSFGVFRLGDMTITGINDRGYFNDENDSRSIFPAGRDLTKVRVEYSQQALTRDESGAITDDSTTTTIQFKGMIADEATRLDIEKDKIKFKVLSRDTAIKKTKVSAGSITNGSLASTAIKAILNTPAITATLNFDPANINVDSDLVIDDGEAFNNLETKSALDQLMGVTNSVFIIDDDDNMIVRSREENTDSNIINLFGKHDIYRRENIIKLKSYNTGLHRMFNNIKVNNQNKSDDILQRSYGVRTKEITHDFITNDTTESDIAARLLREWRAPKIELEAIVQTSNVNAELLDLVSINYPLRVRPLEGDFLPVVGVAKIGDAITPLPRTFGSISISPDIAFKIIEIKHDTKKFETSLKLRQKGISLSDGTFSEPGSCILGFAIVNDGLICGQSDPCDAWNPSVLGAAQLGCTKIA